MTEPVRIVVEDDILFLPNFYINIHRAINTAPEGWDILQFFTNNMDQVEHQSKIAVDWLRWLPHHWGTMIYVVKKQTAQKILSSIHKGDRYIFPYSNIIVADEFLYWKYNTFTYTKTMVTRVASFGSSIQPSVNIEHQRLHALMRIPTISVSKIESTLSIITIMNVLSSSDLSMQWVRLMREVHLMNSYYVHAPSWHVLICVRQHSRATHIQRTLDSFDNHTQISFKVLYSPDHTDKWVQVGKILQGMPMYDDILYKDFEQTLTGFPWNTFLIARGSSIISSPFTESVKTSMSRAFLSRTSPGLSYDGLTWRRKRKNDFIHTNAQQAAFIGHYFLLFEGSFAKWFFSFMLDHKDISHVRLDHLWCGAAHQWSESRVACLFVPVISVRLGGPSLANVPKSSVRVQTDDASLIHWWTYSLRR